MSIWESIKDFVVRLKGDTPVQDHSTAKLPQVPTPIDPKIETRTPVHLFIGLDFGTSTIKCIVTGLVGERRRRERNVVPICGQLLYPSLASELGGVLHIGQSVPAGRVFRSVKACLRCSVLENESCRSCFQETALNAEMVSWAILSHCVNHIRGQIRTIYPPEAYEIDWQRNVEWNMGVPLDGLEQESLYKLFCNLLWRAVHFGQDIEDQISCSQLQQTYRDLEFEVCPPRSESNCFVISEADVAVNGFVNSEHNIEDGLYFICDLGAGTLDVSVFRFAQEIKRPIVFYGTSSTRVGGDDFASILAECQQGPPSKDPMVEANALLIGGIEDVELGPRDWEGRIELFASVYDRIRQGRSKALERGYAKEKVWSHWKGLQGAIIGGATKIVGVRPTCFEPLSYGNKSENIDPAGVSLRFDDVEGATPLHGIAFGLSIPVAEHLESWQPHEVEAHKVRHKPYDPFPAGDPYAK